MTAPRNVMTRGIIVLLATCLPLQVQAMDDLILNCQFDNSTEVKASPDSLPEDFSSMSFSAIVRMKNDGSVSIDTTAPFCVVYIGTFDEHEISGRCERILGTTNVFSTLAINRITGVFDHALMYGPPSRDKPPKKVIVSNGRCTPGKRLF